MHELLEVIVLAREDFDIGVERAHLGLGVAEEVFDMTFQEGGVEGGFLLHLTGNKIRA